MKQDILNENIEGSGLCTGLHCFFFHEQFRVESLCVRKPIIVFMCMTMCERTPFALYGKPTLFNCE